MQSVLFEDLGVIAYPTAWDYQEQLLQQNLQCKANLYEAQQAVTPIKANTTHHFLLCEHPHVYTLGKSGHIENLFVNNEKMAELNVTFHKTNRGGDITYHGPGQIVGYPILDLEHFYTDLGKYMRSLEEVIIRTIAHYGIVGDRIADATGVWLAATDTQPARKICAMGVRSSRWVTMHGFALNINTDLSYFNYIVPCGITDKSVTSLQAELKRPVDIEEVKVLLLKEFEQVFSVNLVHHKVA
jgi:lipoyl(octanoyl) transferase